MQYSCKQNVRQNSIPSYAIVIHGGAGTIMKQNMSPEKEKQYKIVLNQA